jgi:hypothetical protein
LRVALFLKQSYNELVFLYENNGAVIIFQASEWLVNNKGNCIILGQKISHTSLHFKLPEILDGMRPGINKYSNMSQVFDCKL